MKMPMTLAVSALLLTLGTPAMAASSTLAGKILLQVEEHGEAWYVDPRSNERYFLYRPENAFAVMRERGIGISDADLARIPVRFNDLIDGRFDGDQDGLEDAFEDAIGTDKSKADTDGDGSQDGIEVINGYNPDGAGRPKTDLAFAAANAGKIFLQVQGHGEAWWVNPADGHRHFLGRPADAFKLLRRFGLGITNANLSGINTAVTSLDPQTVSGEATVAGIPEWTTYADARVSMRHPKEWEVDTDPDTANSGTRQVQLADPSERVSQLTATSTDGNIYRTGLSKIGTFLFLDMYKLDGTVPDFGDFRVWLEVSATDLGIDAENDGTYVDTVTIGGKEAFHYRRTGFGFTESVIFVRNGQELYWFVYTDDPDAYQGTPEFQKIYDTILGSVTWK